jgi:NAD(P)-dependent dehydrogenase (short-subunit alcohol dehydrogenase family)
MDSSSQHQGFRRLYGSRAIVTGAGAGIGQAIARRLSAEGAHVVCADIDPESASQTADALPGESMYRQVDVRDASQVEALISGVVDSWQGLDVLVNNAGVGVAATTCETSESDFQHVVDVCLKGTFLGMKYGIPALRQTGGGSVVNISSIAALVGLKDRAVYCAAKGGVLALTRAAAIDHVEEGVRVNCVVPGTVDTPWVERITAGYEDPQAARAAMQQRQPHGRLVTPEEIAAAVAYLASEEAASVVGAGMVVDGGMTAR